MDKMPSSRQLLPHPQIILFFFFILKFKKNNYNIFNIFLDLTCFYIFLKSNTMEIIKNFCIKLKKIYSY